MRLNELAGLLVEEEFSSAGTLFLNQSPAGKELRDQGFGAVVMGALPYSAGEPKDLSTPEDPHVRLAPFARANYYQEALVRLKRVVRRIGANTGRGKKDFRIFVNSSLPEKALALEAGLGFQGRNSLLITPAAGSLVILAGIALPGSPGEPTLPVSAALGSCGSCRLCADACPTGAIRPEGGVDVSRCLQALSTRTFPERYWNAWDNRFYGCQICQEVCPHNRKATEGISTDIGVLGPSLSLRNLLLRGDRLKEGLKGSVLDRKWIQTTDLLRNALIAAGNHPHRKAVQDELRLYEDHGAPAVRAAARRAIARTR